MKKLVVTLLIVGGGVALWMHFKTVHRPPVSVVSQKISDSIGKVTDIQTSGDGAPIVVFAEDHGSISGQIEQALMLTRLHNHYKLQNVVLEGYSGSKLDIAAKNVRDTIARHPGSSVERIAATLVREGEISAAEFLALVYPDIHVQKGESGGGAGESEQQTEEDLYFNSRPLLALIALERGALPVDQAEDFIKHLNALYPVDSAEKLNGILELCEPVIARDPWTKEHNDALFPGSDKMVSIEQELSAVQEIKTEAGKLPPAVAPLASAVDKFEAFLDTRAKASEELAKAAIEKAEQRDVAVVALVIGAAHTSRVTQLLGEAHSTYAVLRSDAMDAPGDVRLRGKAYDRKINLETVSADLSDSFDYSFPVASTTSQQHKPGPVLDQEWLSAKAEIYSATDDIVQALAGAGSGGGGGGGSGGGIPPYRIALGGMSDDRFHGGFIFIDRNKVEEVQEGDRTLYIFPVVLNPNDSPHSKTIWVKAAYSPIAAPPPGDTSKAEAALREAFAELQSDHPASAGQGGKGGGDEPSSGGTDSEPADEGKHSEGGDDTSGANKAKIAATLDARPREIRVSRKVAMAVADSKEEVMRRQLTL